GVGSGEWSLEAAGLKIYSKTGDGGETGLFGGGRVPKDDRRVAAYGEVDELNAALGLALALEPRAFARDLLELVQRDLFTIGAELASPDPAKLGKALPGPRPGDGPRPHQRAARRLLRHPDRPRAPGAAAGPGARRVPRGALRGDHGLARQRSLRRASRHGVARRQVAGGRAGVSGRGMEQDEGD